MKGVNLLTFIAIAYYEESAGEVLAIILSRKRAQGG
jgi:hypothetical protein